MIRKLSLALTAAAALVPAVASPRGAPARTPHCSECLSTIVAGGGPAARRAPGAVPAPDAVVRTGGAQGATRVARPAVARTGRAAAAPATPCTGSCCRTRA